MSVSYLTLFAQAKEESIDDLFAQAESGINNDAALQRKIAKTLPPQMTSDKMSIYHEKALAEKIAKLQGKLDKNDPQKQESLINRKHSF